MPLTQPDLHTLDSPCRYIRQAVAGTDLPAQLLGAIGFGSPTGIDARSGALRCGLTSLGDPDLREVWHAAGPVTRGASDGCQWAHDGGQLLIGLHLDERAHPDYCCAVEAAYRRLLSECRTLGFPHLIRAWNYLPAINAGEGDGERYRRFCEGRLTAFIHSGYAPQRFPAACAVGHSGAGTLIYLLASSTPGRHFENPRQIRAYHYPRDYGPASPSFARATLAESAAGRSLYVSGTASILGHASVHQGSFGRQLETTCDNIGALLDHVAERLGETGRPAMSLLKVYLRRPEHLAAARAGIARRFGPDVPTAYLQADICRRELLIEIDGIADLG